MQYDTEDVPPSTMVSFTCVFVFITLIFTSVATMLMTFSLLSDEWEYLSYNRQMAEAVASSHNHSLEWIGTKTARVEKTTPHPKTLNSTEEERLSRLFYLISAFGGVNSLCVDATEQEREKMKQDGYEYLECISYLSHEEIVSKDAWLDRMRNLAMSCSIVSLILLGCSAPLGILGVLKKQISTIMVTGVMYILAAVFGIFTLAFMHFKRVKPEGYYTSTDLDRNVPIEYMKTRMFTVGWPPSMGWGGLSLCFIASILWLLLAKIMRFQVLSPT